jgi:hypothetical protein
MRITSEGVRRSLLVGDIARMQAADAEDAAAYRSPMIDWSRTDGGELFCGPVPEIEDIEVEWIPDEPGGVAHRALQRASAVARGNHHKVA